VFTEERQKKILGLIQRRGRLRISELTGLVPFATFEDVDHLLIDEITDRGLLRQLRHEKIDLIICNEKKSGAKK
jgi:DeoR/GlpR family transcriptional regulator of sugar metabolism